MESQTRSCARTLHLEMTDIICKVCQESFTSSKSKQKYCSYDCYLKENANRSRAYYRELRTANVPLEKMCPACHEQFDSSKGRTKYCSFKCYHEACLEKNRVYMQQIRENYRKIHPPSERTRSCDLCGSLYLYKTKQGKYCSKCTTLARKLTRGQGSTALPASYAALPPGSTLLPGNLEKTSQPPREDERPWQPNDGRPWQPSDENR